jgi:uncharacterized protein (DUF2147 family)
MRILMLMMVFLSLVMPLQAGETDPLLGLWATPAEDEGGQAHVEITRKGDGYSGKLVWLAEPVYLKGDEQGMDGQAKVDRENPDPALKTKPVKGLVVLDGFVRSGDNKWTDGTIYDPNNGKTYSCKLQLKGNRLKVRGYIGISLLGRTTYWTRVKE